MGSCTAMLAAAACIRQPEVLGLLTGSLTATLKMASFASGAAMMMRFSVATASMLPSSDQAAHDTTSALLSL